MSSSSLLLSSLEHQRLYGVRGSDGIEGLSMSSLKRMPQARLAYSFSSEVSSWFIIVSFEETSSSSDESEESSLESHNRFLTVEDSASSCILRLPSLLDAILWRRERERVIDWTNERAIACSAIYSRHRCIFEETPRSCGIALQIHSSNGPMTHTHCYIG
jgi:hypothetical protein